jgi:Spy/CpxP family protein refolding chaperone
MKINLLAVGAFAAALAMPLGAYAQQDQQYPGPPQGHAATPSHDRLQHRWMRRLSHLNLSNDQQQRIQSMIDQYSQSHPEGSPFDPNANRDLRNQIMGVLSSDQQNQFQQEMRAHRAAMRQREGQMQQGQQDQGPPQQDQGPPQQYQGPPQQYQGPPQQYQGPPQGEQPPPDQAPPAAPPQ